MQIHRLPTRVQIPAPGICSGEYVYLEGSRDLWTWYKNGERNTTDWHFTVSSRNYDTREDGEWIGFHVTIPMRFNFQICYGINNGGVHFRHLANLKHRPEREADEFREYYETNKGVILEFARNIHFGMAGLNDGSLQAAKDSLKATEIPEGSDWWKTAYIGAQRAKASTLRATAAEFVPSGGQ